MSFLKRRIRWLLAPIIATLITGVLLTNQVTGQQRPDGGNDGPETETHIINTCGAELNSVVVTDDTATTTTSTAFVSVPNMSASISIPGGTTDCVLVTFSAESACGTTGGSVTDFCYIEVRAVGGGSIIPLLPTGGSFLAFDSEASTARSHSHQFIRRLSGGTSGITYSIQVRWRTGSSSTSFFLDDKTLTVERKN